MTINESSIIDNKLIINNSNLTNLEISTKNTINEVVISNNSILENISIDSEVNNLIFDNNIRIEMDEIEYAKHLQTAEYYKILN